MNVGPFSTSQFNGIRLEDEPQPMKTGKSKSWLGEYHWVSLASHPDVTDSTNDAVAWCEETFGKSGGRWFEKDRKFYFKDEKDQTMFVLRWSDASA